MRTLQLWVGWIVINHRACEHRFSQAHSTSAKLLKIPSADWIAHFLQNKTTLNRQYAEPTKKMSIMQPQIQAEEKIAVAELSGNLITQNPNKTCCTAHLEDSRQSVFFWPCVSCFATDFKGIVAQIKDILFSTFDMVSYNVTFPLMVKCYRGHQPRGVSHTTGRRPGLASSGFQVGFRGEGCLTWGVC